MKTFIHLFTGASNLLTYLDDLNIDYSSRMLVQIYTHPKDADDLKVIHRIIVSKLPCSQILGTISDANMVTLDFYTSGTTIVFTCLDKADFKVFAHDLVLDGAELGERICSHDLSPSSKLAVLFANIDSCQCDAMLQTLKHHMPDLIIAGGILPKSDVSHIYANDTFMDFGVVGYILDGMDLMVSVRSNIHYMPIGRSHVVTDSCRNVIRTIDNMPAKDFYEKYLGTVELGAYPELGYTFPLLIHHGQRHLPKPILSITPNGEIITNTDIPAGKMVTLGYGSIQHLIEKNAACVDDLDGSFCECAIVFTGIYRHEASLSSIRYNLHEDAPPTYGFYTQCEFVTHDSEAFVSIGSMQLITIAEHRHGALKRPLALVADHQTDKIETCLLLRLVENTSMELNHLNQTLESIVQEKTLALSERLYQDELTKLPNHNKLMSVLAREHTRSLALIDISAFININNFYGNYIGNKLLTELAKLITTDCEEHGYTTYRVHADIFAIAGEETNPAAFNRHVQALQAKIHHHCFMELSLEIYITTVIATAHNRAHLYEDTSMTLEYAKSNKIPFLIYNSILKIEDSIKNNLIWTSKIRTAIEKDKIVPYYQPICNNTTGERGRYEVLMRLIDEDNAVIPPNQFLQIAKRANLYKQLTKIIIEKAFNHFADTEYRFSINLSSEDILDEDMRSFIYEKLDGYPKSHHVTFEIVESEGIENYDEVKKFIQITKTHGVQIAIDDFGTGFSNFHYLFKLNVDLIKIDGSIIQQINGEKAASLVAETIVDFAKKMGIATVAEFVSDEAIFKRTTELGINYSQGYYVAKPSALT